MAKIKLEIGRTLDENKILKNLILNIKIKQTKIKNPRKRLSMIISKECINVSHARFQETLVFHGDPPTRFENDSYTVLS